MQATWCVFRLVLWSTSIQVSTEILKQIFFLFCFKSAYGCLVDFEPIPFLRPKIRPWNISWLVCSQTGRQKRKWQRHFHTWVTVSPEADQKLTRSWPEILVKFSSISCQCMVTWAPGSRDLVRKLQRKQRDRMAEPDQSMYPAKRAKRTTGSDADSRKKYLLAHLQWFCS